MLDLSLPIPTRHSMTTPKVVDDRVALERWVRHKVQVWGWDLRDPNIQFGVVPWEEFNPADRSRLQKIQNFAALLQDELLHFEDRKGNPRQPDAGSSEHGGSTYSVHMDRHHGICRALKRSPADHQEAAQAA